MKKIFNIILVIIAIITLFILQFLIYHYERQNTIAKDEITPTQSIKNMSNGEIEEHYFYGKVVESSQNHIIVEPNEDEEIRKASDKIVINLGKENDSLFVTGTNVKVTYTGYIMETYPAQIDVLKIELKSVEDFELKFYDKHPQNNTKIDKILDKTETKKHDYNIYTYDGQVNIVIKGKEISLRNALLEDKITMNEIIAQANKDEREGKIKSYMYKDGGSIEYKYDSYTIIKLHRISENDNKRDVYIGRKEFTINDIK